MKTSKNSSTISVHGTTRNSEKYGSVVTPIFQASAFLFPFGDEKIKYPRYSNLPNQEEAVSRIVELEGAEDGMLFSSGMGAISTVLLTILKPGDHLIIQDQIYGGTASFVESHFKDLKIEVTSFDFAKNPDFSGVIKNNTKAVYIESPSNPLLKVVDIPAVAELAHKKNLYSIIDNTFASPINQKPIEMGIDIVVHSATKYLNGHSDLNAGIAVGKKEFMKSLKIYARDLGCTTNDSTAYLLTRGMKTLAIRVERQNLNALILAQYLEKHKKISTVNYPGLESHPQHELAKKMMKGFGGMLSIEANLNNDELDKALGKLQYFSRAVSLGGVESLICLPKETSHSYLSKEDRANLGIKDNLIRISVGIEDIEDLISDWEEALAD
jgi:cysteine-S-conjugate beta-lyase